MPIRVRFPPQMRRCGWSAKDLKAGIDFQTGVGVAGPGLSERSNAIFKAQALEARAFLALPPVPKPIVFAISLRLLA